jgi:serine/threonine protein phosphatase PrpC
MLENGAPLLDTTGDLVGIQVIDNKVPGSVNVTSDLQTSLAAVNKLMNTTSPTLAGYWNNGMNYFYQQHQYAQAQLAFQKATALSSGFKAASFFAQLAGQKVQQRPPANPIISNPLPDLNNLSTLQLIEIGSASAGVLLLLLAALIIVLRARKRRRELKRFASETEEARLQAEANVRQSQQEITQLACPRCHKTVQRTDGMCPFCGTPLHPSASGLRMKRVQTEALPPVSASLSPAEASIADQPTVQILPPPPPVEPVTIVAGEEKTARRTSSVNTVEIQQGRNLSVAVGTRSDPGLKRKHKPNEDSLFAAQGSLKHQAQPQQFGLFVVADGMGGHANGQDASRTAIQTIIDFILPRLTNGTSFDDAGFQQLLGDGVQAANQAVHQRNMTSGADMGTTMTGALVIGATAYVANVGDSRTYLYRLGQGLSKVTTDHSVVASLVEAGIIKPDDIYTHPKRNQIYRSLGEKPVVEVDTFKVDLQPGDKLLLCSDGLWDMVRDPLIQQVIAQPLKDPNKIGQDLIQSALEGGGEDNVSVIVVQFSEQEKRTSMAGFHLLAKPDSVIVPKISA